MSKVNNDTAVIQVIIISLNIINMAIQNLQSNDLYGKKLVIQ